MRSSVLMVIGVLLVFSVRAQQTIVSGKVVASDTWLALVDAEVSLSMLNVKGKTNSLGKFQIVVPKIGEYKLVVAKEGYVTKTFEIQIEPGEKLDIGMIVLELLLVSDSDYTVLLSEEDLNDNEGGAITSTGLLQATQDVFSRTAAYDFGSTFFKRRGLEGQYSEVLINGVKMNKWHHGRVNWNNWGGLNDVFRNRSMVQGVGSVQRTFGGVSSTIDFNVNAIEQQEGGRVSYAASNRSYGHRMMASYNSGLGEKGWAYTFSMGRRWGGDRQRYESRSVFVSLTKVCNDRHQLSLTALYTPLERSRSSALTKEVFELKGRAYNPNLGWQSGRRRFSRLNRVEEPLLILGYDWKWSESVKISTIVGYQFGSRGNSRLDYNNLVAPSPVYYQKLPSYFVNQGDLSQAYHSLKELQSDGQLNWEELYYANAYAKAQGKSNVVMQYEDVSKDHWVALCSILHYERKPGELWYGGVRFKYLNSQNFAKVLDLLGGNGYLDIDHFGVSEELDVGSVDVDSNVLTPRRIVLEDEKVKYHYDLNASEIDGFVQWAKDFDKVSCYAGVSTGVMQLQRNGKFKNGYYQELSFGKGERLSFISLGFKLGGSFNFSPKHLGQCNLFFKQKPPTFQNVYANVRQSNLVQSRVAEEKLIGADWSYFFRSRGIRLRCTFYYNRIKDATARSFYYGQGLSKASVRSAFVQEIVSGIRQQNIGVEIGGEYSLNAALRVKGVIAIGDYSYVNNPELLLYSDDFENPLVPVNYGEVSLKNYKISGGPQRAYSLGLEYRDPKYWWLGITANYFSHSYLGVSALKRTANFNVDEDGILHQFYNDDVARVLLAQEQLDAYLLVNLVGGKSWKLGRYYLGVFGSVNNVFNQYYVSGGYEQSRLSNYRLLLEDKKRVMPMFGAKYWFGRGTTYYVNTYVRF